MRKYNFGFMTVAMAALAACGGSGTDDASTNNDASTSETAVDAGPGQTLTFVLDHLTIDSNVAPDMPHTGFNLDNLYSTDQDTMSCGMIPDFFSSLDQDQNCQTSMETCPNNPNNGCDGTTSGCRGGVDNQLPQLASLIHTASSSTDIGASLQNAVSDNSLALIVRISGVNDMTNDDSVHIAVYRAYPTFSTGCSSVMAGREYSIDSSFVSSGTTSIDNIDANATVAFEGKIVNGRVRITSSGSSIFNLPISVMGFTLVLPLHALQLRANVTAAGLQTGMLGGWVAGSDVVAGVHMFAPQYDSVIGPILVNLLDIAPAATPGTCVDNSTPTGGISLGLGLTALPATISSTATVVSAPAAGTCAASTADGG